MKKPIGFLFPGQGAQFVGMGKDLIEQSPAARAVYEKADATLGYSISKICFEGPETELTRTLYAQTGILVTSLAALAALREKIPELEPSLVAGLSLGEFTALTASGAISFEDALKLVQIRAEAMESAAKNNPGTMASVMGLDVEQCRIVAQEAGCEVANLNTPDQTVLSGTLAAIEKACKIAEAKGAKRAMPLKVGGAFHSSLMSDAKARLEAALAKTSVQKPRCSFIPNVTAQTVSDPEMIRSLLAKQLTSSVQWVRTMAVAKESGIATYLEIGPGKVLKGLARKCQPELEVLCFGGMADFKTLEPLALPAKS
ncbi:MAG TPA: ACP S-malonyltransferase [Candidatus Omnitrophota bacterium]|nr:ACP S-malonyltransferase [Candidatus Omnitrophota bacterium]HRY85221.1 ACP S-malonyltransferase [Candidatus Omnitrophota bacterium]